jgi:hypothetical protein
MTVHVSLKNMEERCSKFTNSENRGKTDAIVYADPSLSFHVPSIFRPPGEPLVQNDDSALQEYDLI